MNASNPGIDVRAIIETTLVPHLAFEEAKKRMAQCFAYASSSCEPICLAIIGESRTGKSRVLEDFRCDYPPQRDSAGLQVPILYVRTPPKPTVKSFAELLLVGMGDPSPNTGTENSKTARLKKLMKAAGTKMVMIDEFQHFQDKGTDKIAYHVADWLKDLVDESHAALVVAGIPTCRAVINRNVQLAGRFQAPVEMPRFDWSTVAHREQFTAILEAFYVALSAHFSLPELDSDEMAYRCYCATGGLMGYLANVLRQAVWNAIDEDTNVINLADLEQAHRVTLWNDNGSLGMASPFAHDFSASPTADMLSRVKRIGVQINDTHLKPRNTSSRNKPAKLGQVLSAH